jgi:uncharacterized protein
MAGDARGHTHGSEWGGTGVELAAVSQERRSSSPSRPCAGLHPELSKTVSDLTERTRPSMKLVLDTNVVLDWLIFDDPSIHPLRDGIHEGRVVVVTHARAIDELRRVLSYRHFELDLPRQTRALERYQAHTSRLPVEEHTSIGRMELPAGFPRCRDPDDDHFLALAYHAKAHALVSKDKKVLKCRRRSTAFGFTILSVPHLVAALEAQLL